MSSRSFSTTLIAAYDERCGLCQRFASLQSALSSPRGRASVVASGARAPAHPALRAFPLPARLHELHVAEVDAQGVSLRVHTGYEAVEALVLRTRVAPLARPFLALLRVTGVGRMAYARVAAGSWRARCTDGGCPV